MTRSELWAAYCKRNPSFADDNATVTMPVRGLRKLFEQTWDKSKEAVTGKPATPFDDFMDMLKR